MFANPMVALVFFIREHGRGRLFVEACGDGEAAGAGADDEDVKEFGEGCHCVWGMNIVIVYALEVAKGI